MKECDEKSRELQQQLGNEVNEHIPHIGLSTPVHNRMIRDKAVNTLIREIDASENEVNYAKSKVPEHWEWLDIEARNTFHEGVGAGTLKCITGFNHYGTRNEHINNGMVSNRCPRCNREESWEHVILCESIEELKVKYIKTLEEKINKIKRLETVREQVDLMLSDIKQYLMEGVDVEGHTTQSVIGISLIFRG